MTPAEKRQTIERYNARLLLYGVSEKTLGWGDKGRSKLRFEILLSAWNLERRSILDFGCGFGSLYDQLKRKVSVFKYQGIDINPALIAVARRLHPRVSFQVHDLLQKPLKSVDYVLSSGVFNHRLRNNWGFIQKAFARFNRTARKGFAVNFLSDKVEYPLGHTYHANPGRILELAYQYSNNVVLRNDYMPYEFTIFVNKAVPVHKASTVYASHAHLV